MHEPVFVSLLWITGAAALAPIVVGLLRGPRIPEVVLLLTLGIVIGPYGLELAAKSEPIELLSELGLGLLFLIAGLEIDPASIASRTGAKAFTAWAISLVVALGLMLLLSLVTDLPAWAAIAIALTSTALGTLLPILRDTGLKDQPIGRLVMVNGAAGELGPIVAMSVFLTGGNAWGALLSLLLFALVALLVNGAIIRHGTRAERVVEIVRHGAETTAQAPLRLVMVLLVAMLALSEAFGLDIILGAFIAGATVRVLLPPEHEGFLARLDGIAFGLLVPVFFVTSGMGIDFRVVLDRWGTVLVLFLLIVVVRGLPVLLLFRDLPRGEPLRLALFSATGLPIIVAVTTVAVEAGSLKVEGQSLVVAAGMLTVLVLPLLAVELGRRSLSSESASP
ncbi:putative Cation/H+ antiporter [metagenome]|uniref:Putative Cation/H+ antiporter n=1 Tax=metagenome TaxID=256318 RepID=A0A2P2BY74_9ZZZZ